MAKSILDQMLSGEIPMGINAFKEKKDKWESEFQSVSQFFWYPDNMSQDAVRRKIAFRADSAASYLSDRKTKKTAAEKEGLKFLKENPKKWAYMGIPDDIAVEFGLDVDFPADEDDKLLKALKKMKNERDESLLIEGKYLAASEKDRDRIEGALASDKREYVLMALENVSKLEAAYNGMTMKLVESELRNLLPRSNRPGQISMGRVPATTDMPGYHELSAILAEYGCDRITPQKQELDAFNALLERHSLSELKAIILELKNNRPFSAAKEFIPFTYLNKYEDDLTTIVRNNAEIVEAQSDDVTSSESKEPSFDYMKALLQKACTIAQKNFEPRPWQALAFDNIVSALKGPACAAELPLSVGFGKTYLTPLISMISNSMGHPFVYTCYTKSTILDAMEEAKNLVKNLREKYEKELTPPEWVVLNDFFKPGKGLLWIPSRLDGVRNFFVKSDSSKFFNEGKSGGSDDETLNDKLLNECMPAIEPQDRAGLRALIDEWSSKNKLNIRDFSKNGLDKKALKRIEKEIDATNKIIDYAKSVNSNWNSLIYALKEMSSDNELLKQSATDKASDYETVLLNFLSLVCEKEFHDDVLKMADEYKWLPKLYPGVLTRRAKSIYITFSKMSFSLEPFGSYRDSTLINTKRDNKGVFTVFVDESDMYCHKMISQKAEAATKYPINLEDFVTRTYHKLDSFCDLTEEKGTDEKGRTYKKRRKTLRIDPAIICGEKYVDKLHNVYNTIGDFVKTHNFMKESSDSISTKLVASEDYETSTPRLNVSGDRIEFFSGHPKDSKGKFVNNVNYYIDVQSELNRVLILCLKDSESNGRELLSEYIRKLSHLVNIIIGMLRYIVDEKLYDVERALWKNNKDNKNEDVNEVTLADAGYTRREEIRSILDLFRYDDTQKKFIEAFMLHPRKETVDSTSFYAQGFSIIPLVDDATHHYSTYIHSTRIMKLPDYDLANLIYNSNFVILSSGTGSMASLQNADLKYIEEAVGEKRKADLISFMEEQNADFDPDLISAGPVFAEMPDIERASLLLKEHQQNDILKDIRIVPLIYTREDKPYNTECKADREHYKEATGHDFNIDLLQHDDLNHPKKVTNSVAVGNLCYTAWAFSKMLENGAHTGLIYLNVLPAQEKGRNVFNISESLREASQFIARKYNKDPHSCEIRLLNSKRTSEMKNRLVAGIGDNDYILWCSQVDATGAGFSPYYHKLMPDGVSVDRTTKYDVDSIFLGKITNVIAGNDDIERPIDEKLLVALEDEYALTKFAKLEARRNKYFAAKCYEELPRILNNIFIGNNKFSRNICPDDPQSPYHLTIGARVLQEFARADRGHLKNGVALMAVTSDLIETKGVTRQIYKGIPTTYLFDVLLDKVEEYLEEHHESIVLDDKLANIKKNYVKENKSYLDKILRILSNMERAKVNGAAVPLDVLYRYEWFRDAAMSFGYNKNGDAAPDGYFTKQKSWFIESSLKKYHWDVMLGYGDRDYNRQENAYIKPSEQMYNGFTAARFVEDMDFYRRCGLFGTGWESLFDSFLKNENEIREYGFKYPILTECYYVLMGIFYEHAFKAMSLFGGFYDIGYKLIDLDPTQVEDADMQYEGTRVFVDVKGYRQSHDAPDHERLAIKASRYKGEKTPLFIVLNASPTDRAPSGESLDSLRHCGTYDLYIINGVGGLDESPVEVRERLNTRKANLKKLCELYADD